MRTDPDAQAMQAALDALENAMPRGIQTVDWYLYRKAIGQLRERLAQPAPEPAPHDAPFLPSWANYRQGVADGMDEAAEWMDDAAEEIESWGSYAGEYFQKKHDLAESVQRFRDRAATLRERLAQPAALGREQCQYAQDVSMPEYSCANGCEYEKMDSCKATPPAALAAPCSCAGCSKPSSEGWALYCVECAEQIQPSRVISDAEIVDEAGAFTRDAQGVANLIAFARAIIAKVEGK